jgi:hypothetical protein
MLGTRVSGDIHFPSSPQAQIIASPDVSPPKLRASSGTGRIECAAI